jgi:putative transposase
MNDPLRFIGKVLEVIVSRTADQWFLSVTVEIPDPSCTHRENPAVVGVDVGVSALAMLSIGEKIAGPKAYAAALKKLRQLSKHFVRQGEAAPVPDGLKPGKPIPKGMPIPWPANMRKNPIGASPDSGPGWRISGPIPCTS